MAPMARERHALAVLVLVLALVRSSSGKACGTDIEGAEDVSAVTQILPRMNFKLKVVKPKMADYEWMKWDPMCTRKPFVCFKTSKTNAYGVIDGDNCGHSFGKLGCYEQNTGIDLDDMDISALQKELAPEMGANYLQGVLTFSLFLLGIAVLSLPCSCLCQWWVCCCCCKRGCCDVRTAKGEDDADVEEKKPARKFCQTCCCILTIALLVGGGGVGIFLGYTKGNSTLKDSMVSLVESPKAFADLSNRAMDIGSATIDVADKVLNVVVAVNTTLGAAVDMNTLSTSLKCVGALLDNLPDPGVIKGELQRINTGLNIIPSSSSVSSTMGSLKNTIAALEPQLDNIKGNISATSSALTSVTQGGLLTSLATAIPFTFGNVSATQASAVGVQNNINALVGAVPADADVNSINTELTALGGDSKKFAKSIDGTSTSNGEYARLQTLITKLQVMSAAMTNLSSKVDGADAAIRAFNSSTITLNANIGSLNASLNAVDSALGSVPNLTAFGGLLLGVNSTIQGFDIDGIEALLKSVQLVTTQYMPNASLIRGEMAKVESALKGITCVGAFAAVIKRVNDTIIRVPPETDSIVGQLQNMDSMSAQIRNMTGQLDSQITDFNKTAAELTKLDTGSYLTQIAGLRTQLNSAGAMSGAASSLGAMDASLRSAGNSGVSTQINTLTSGLASGGTIPSSLYSDLAALKSSTATAASNINQVVTSLKTWDTNANAAYQTGVGPNIAVPSGIASAFSGIKGPTNAAKSISSGLSSFVGTSVPSSGTFVTEINAADKAIGDAKTEVSSVQTTIGSVQSQLGQAKTVESAISGQWSTISGVLSTVKPVIASAITQVGTFETALKAVPSDAKSTFSSFEAMLGQLTAMQSQFTATLDSTRAQLGTQRATIAKQRDNPLSRMYLSNESAPDFSKYEEVEDALDALEKCKGAPCLAAGIAWVHDNLGLVAGYMGGNAILGSPVSVPLSMQALNVVLYTFTAIGMLLGVLGVGCRKRALRWLSIEVLMLTIPLFLLIAAIWYPLVVFSAGICEGIEPTAVKLVEGDTELGLALPILMLYNKTAVLDQLTSVVGDKFNITYPVGDVQVSGIGPLIKHYFEADADTGAYCTPDGKLKGLDSLVDMAGGLAQNLTLEMIDWGVGTVNKIGTLRPAMSKHIVDLRDITAKDVPAVVTSISQLAGCKPINEAYYAVKTAWCCKVTASLWWMVFGYTLIGLCSCFSTCSMGCFECHCGYGEDEESDDPELTRLSQQAKRKEQDAKFGRGKGESVSKPRGPQRPVYDDDDDGDYLPPHRSTARGGGGRGGGGSMVMEMDDYDEDYPRAGGRRNAGYGDGYGGGGGGSGYGYE